MRLSGLLGFLMLFIPFTNLNAQEVTDYDLRNFAYSYLEMMQLNKAAQKEMVALMEKEGLDLDVYHAIHESRNTDYEPDVDQSEYDKYQKLQPQLLVMEMMLEDKVTAVFEKNDLTRQKYKAISERVKQDIILQTKLEKIIPAHR